MTDDLDGQVGAESCGGEECAVQGVAGGGGLLPVVQDEFRLVLGQGAVGLDQGAGCGVVAGLLLAELYGGALQVGRRLLGPWCPARPFVRGPGTTAVVRSGVGGTA
ncbi:hypothetical protein [Actinacidiphila glaucinigra]|uniref:hypothetical protein n=1 Tax=Actinacidiphila glaucinigra TaxID=235986 RepID=UPI003D8C157C